MTMEKLYAAMQALWCGCGVPVYAEDRIPDGAAYPYIAWSCADAAFGEAASAQVTCWFRGDYTACIRLLDVMSRRVPEQGVLLRFDGGMALVWCEEAYIQTDAADTSVTGGRLRLGLRCYQADRTKEEKA